MLAMSKEKKKQFIIRENNLNYRIKSAIKIREFI